jgi:23S rRNA pseudouridine1911/1915/1917 synthase
MAAKKRSSQSPTQRWTVDEPSALATFLTARIPGIKRSTLKKRLGNGVVRVNGEVARRHDTPLSPGDVVEMGAGRGPGRAGPPGGLEILHVDDDLVVVDKPTGLLTVSAGRRGSDPTVLTLLGPQLAGSPRLFPCHRLDRETSGLLLVPRNKRTQERMFASWADVEKVYVALADGSLEDDAGLIDAALYEHPRSLSVSVRDGPDARSARTRFRVLERGPSRTLVELTLETGRKHQIRVHLRHLGHPVIGDARYGGGKKEAKRLCLHAQRLAFAHPTTGERLRFESAVPALFRELLDA